MTMGVRRHEDGKYDEMPLRENHQGRCVISKSVSLGDIVRGFGEGDLLALLATKGSFAISTHLSRGLYHGEVISILLFRAIAFVTVICDKCCIRTMCD
jgi:CobQ-like glutamine amidotransferase family enzyme